MNQVYRIITDRIIKELEAGSIPWSKPWKTGNPANLITGEEYHGINRMLLKTDKYTSRYYLTFNQINNLGGHLIKDSKWEMVIFWKLNQYSKETDKETEIKEAPILRYYRVFNIDQTEGIQHERLNEPKAVINSVDEAEKIINNYPNKPTIKFEGDRAYYSPTNDNVVLPPKDTFKDTEGYYATMFHELIHSTGHKSRLDRLAEQNHNFGSEDYSKEELIAELGASFLCSDCNIQSHKEFINEVAYIQSWIKALKNDVSMVISAGSKAEKAVTYIKTGLV